MAKTTSELQTLANQIKNETAEGMNTAARVGSFLYEMVSSLDASSGLGWLCKGVTEAEFTSAANALHDNANTGYRFSYTESGKSSHGVLLHSRNPNGCVQMMLDGGGIYSRTCTIAADGAGGYLWNWHEWQPIDSGKVELYNAPGNNEDGAMTQAATTAMFPTIKGASFEACFWEIYGRKVPGTFKYIITDPGTGETAEGICHYGIYKNPANGDEISTLWRFGHDSSIYYRTISTVNGITTDTGMQRLKKPEDYTITGSNFYNEIAAKIIAAGAGIYNFVVSDPSDGSTNKGFCVYSVYTDGPTGKKISTIWRFNEDGTMSRRIINEMDGTDTGLLPWPSTSKIQSSDFHDYLRYLQIEQVGRIVPFMGFAPTGATFNDSTEITPPAKDLYAHLYFRNNGNKGFYYKDNDGVFYRKFDQADFFTDCLSQFLNEYVIIQAGGGPNIANTNSSGCPRRYVYSADETLVAIN